jgi:hypothetical protein
MLNFKQNNLICQIPAWLSDKADASLMLWAGDCVHGGVTDVERLPDYDVYLCYGFDGLEANLNVNRGPERPICICVIDIHDEQQLNRFTELFNGIFQTINSDYRGNTPRLPMQAYRDLLKPGGSAYNTEGINAVFFPTVAFRDTLELFAPVLPEDLKPRRKWTKSVIELAKDNGLSVGATWTSPDLQIPYYAEIRKEQNMFDESQARRYPGQALYNLPYTADTIEEYWDTLPDHIFLVSPHRGLAWENLDDEWMVPFKMRLIPYLEARVKRSMTVAEQAGFSLYYSTLTKLPDDQLSGLHKAIAAVSQSSACRAVDGLSPMIRFYNDARQADKTIFGPIFTRV